MVVRETFSSAANDARVARRRGVAFMPGYATGPFLIVAKVVLTSADSSLFAAG